MLFGLISLTCLFKALRSFLNLGVQFGDHLVLIIPHETSIHQVLKVGKPLFYPNVRVVEELLVFCFTIMSNVTVK